MSDVNTGFEVESQETKEFENGRKAYRDGVRLVDGIKNYFDSVEDFNNVLDSIAAIQRFTEGYYFESELVKFSDNPADYMAKPQTFMQTKDEYYTISVKCRRPVLTHPVMRALLMAQPFYGMEILQITKNNQQQLKNEIKTYLQSLHSVVQQL